jgi:hypothetical protein
MNCINIQVKLNIYHIQILRKFLGAWYMLSKCRVCHYRFVTAVNQLSIHCYKNKPSRQTNIITPRRYSEDRRQEHFEIIAQPTIVVKCNIDSYWNLICIIQHLKFINGKKQ